jgi:ribosome-binding ATPase YchF (GTP1/OBG family)
MRIGIVGYQGSGKSTVFELLTGVKPDLSKAHVGQVAIAVVPDERFERLVAHHKPKKLSPAKIELFDTPGLSRSEQHGNAQKLGVIRESTALVHVVNAFAGGDAAGDVEAFLTDIVLADLQLVSNRMERLRKDLTKPIPNREELQAELAALEPVESRLSEGLPVWDMEFSELQEKATKSFSLLSRKRHLVLLNTADSSVPAAAEKIAAAGYQVVSGPVGLELEVQQLAEEERELFAAEMGLTESCRDKLLKAIFELTGYITFYTCDEKEVHAWLLKKGSSALEAAGTIHTDLARGFIRAEIMSTDDLLRLGSEREVKAAGLHRTEGKEYVMRDGDEIVVRFNV